MLMRMIELTKQNVIRSHHNSDCMPLQRSCKGNVGTTKWSLYNFIQDTMIPVASTLQG